MATLPDDRIRFPAPKIDFATEVGLTGQPHDNFPAPGQARFDWMRMALIGLLAHQASFEEPVNYRAGTMWFDFTDLTFKVRTGVGVAGTEWSSLASVIALKKDSSGVLTLADWYLQAADLLAGVRPQITFGGRAISDAVTAIPIPESVRPAVIAPLRPFVWVNGLLLDPRLTIVDPATCPTQINLLSGLLLNDGDRFTVLFTAVKDQLFVPGDVLAG